MHFVKLDGEIVATTTPRRVNLVDSIAKLPDGDPRKRFVAMMCLYSRDIHRGEIPGPYSDESAEIYARTALLADEDLDAGVDEDPAELAARARVPVDQVIAWQRDQETDRV